VNAGVSFLNSTTISLARCAWRTVLLEDKTFSARHMLDIWQQHLLENRIVAAVYYDAKNMEHQRCVLVQIAQFFDSADGATSRFP
jgi:hypothetical protein